MHPKVGANQFIPDFDWPVNQTLFHYNSLYQLLYLVLATGISWPTNSDLPNEFAHRLHDDQVLNEILSQVDHLIESKYRWIY